MVKLIKTVSNALAQAFACDKVAMDPVYVSRTSNYRR